MPHLHCTTFICLFVYYESIKRELKIRGIYESRCDERLQTKTKRFTCLPYTGLILELEHLKIETRLISERFANAMGKLTNPIAEKRCSQAFFFFKRTARSVCVKERKDIAEMWSMKEGVVIDT